MTLRTRDRRALLMGAMVILPSIALAKGLPAVRAWEDVSRARLGAVRAEANGARALLAEFRRASNDTGFSAAHVAALRESMFAAPTVPGAAANLAEYLNGICSGLGIAVRSATPRGDTAFIGGLARAGLGLSLVTDTKGVFALLRELEVGPRNVWIRSLVVSQRSPSTALGATESLLVEVFVETIVLRQVDQP